MGCNTKKLLLIESKYGNFFMFYPFFGDIGPFGGKINMLVIRNHQMDTMKNHKRQLFHEKARYFLKQNYPEKSSEYNDQQFDAIIREGMQRSNQYNIKSEQCIIAFLEFMFALSFDFDTNKRTIWTREILSNNNLKESEKIMAIINVLKSK